MSKGDWRFFSDIAPGTRVLVAMSGGVDSSVAAAKLLEMGMEVVGVTMRLVRDETCGVDEEKACCSLEAAKVARKVAYSLGIPHEMIDLSEDFESMVLKPALDMYASGLTPNPCAMCNRFIKFDALFKLAESLRCMYIATGHYSRITCDSEGLHLCRGVDPEKDQSYFLAYLTHDKLEKIIFPLGWSTKSSVREKASRLCLWNADRAESQDLCFLSGDEGGLRHLRGEQVAPGEIVLTDGTVIGYHTGIHNYTVGQRKGLPGGQPEPLYVVEIDPSTNRVIVGTDDETYVREFNVQEVSLVDPKRDEPRLENVMVQVRYRMNPVPGSVILEGEKGTVRLETPVRAVAPGQIAVFYKGDEVIGAGMISLRKDWKRR